MLPLNDELEVTAWMEEFARTPIEGPALIDPSRLWWKAQLRRRLEADRSAVKPIEVGEQVQVAVGAIGALLLLVWLWRTLPTAVMSLSFLAILICSALLVAVAVLLSWDWGHKRLS